MEKESLINEFNRARKTARENSSLEGKAGGEAWGVYGRGIESYDKNFSDLLGESLKDYVIEHPKPFYALDVFAEGQLLRELSGENGISGGLCLTLTDTRNEDQKKFDKDNNISLISGDIYNGNTIGTLKKEMEEKNIDKFDLITCRPLAGWNIKNEEALEDTTQRPTNDASPEMKYIVINNLWKVLSDGGTLLIHFSTYKEDILATLKNWTNKINSAGVKATFLDERGGRMMIQKGEGAPLSLERI